MSRSFNSVTLVGNLTRDPEIRATQGGDEFCRFSLAINYDYKNANGEQVEGVDFVDISVWGGLVSVVKNYCHKGKQVLIYGRLKSSSWEQDGQKRSRLEVRADRLLLLGGSAQSGEANSAKPAKPQAQASNEAEEFEVDGEYDYNQSEIDPEDIPF